MKDLLLAHLVGNAQQQPIALLRRDQRQAEPGVTGRGLDQRVAFFQQSAALGRLDEIQADAVLDGAAGILVLELQEQLARAGVDTPHRHERRVADHLQHVAVARSGHGRDCTPGNRSAGLNWS